jgi:hypothetical protein
MRKVERVRRERRWVAVALVLGVLVLPACKEAATGIQRGRPYTLDDQGTDRVAVV